MALKIAAFLAGLWIVSLTLLSAIRTFVLPRSARDCRKRSSRGGRQKKRRCGH
jgi:hypothetical protein